MTLPSNTPLTVPGLLRARAAELPDALFLWCDDDRITYGDMAGRADRIAAGIAELGVEPGERVAFVCGNRVEMLELMFGCAAAGVIQVPLNSALRGEFLRYQLMDCRAATLVADEAGLAAVTAIADALPGLKRVIALDAAQDVPGVDVVPYARVRASVAPLPAVEIAPGDIMSIVYTSGTTGMPKGCMLPHGYYVNIGAAMQDAWDFQPGDRILTALPMFHTAGRAMIVMASLVHRAATIVERAFHPAKVIPRAIETGATQFGGVGAMGMAMLGLPPSDADRAHSIRHAFFIPFPADAQRRFEERFGMPLHCELFGQTECVPATFSPFEGPRAPGSCGKPAPYLEVRLVDDDDVEVRSGEVGEIVVRPRQSYVMYSGYWNKPEATVEAWRNLWHHTGDYGRLDDDGFIHFVDRKKDALRRRGENVSSMQLEFAIATHPKIVEASVHAVPSDMTEDDIKACIVLREGETITPEETFAFFCEALPHYAVPRYVEVVPQLPKNAMQRVMKHLLRERALNDETWDLHALGLVPVRPAKG